MPVANTRAAAIAQRPAGARKAILNIATRAGSRAAARSTSRPPTSGRPGHVRLIETQHENAFVTQEGIAMSERQPRVYLARHGETPWTLSGQHTGLTDLPLTNLGEENGRKLGERLKTISFSKVYTSPLQRARRTCEFAGFGEAASVDPELVEWNYGHYEGLKTADIRQDWPDWDLFVDGCPGGESPAAVGDRADRVIGRIRSVSGDVLLFSSGHFLRVLAARWVGLEAHVGRYLFLGTSALSVLGFDRNATEPVIHLWNDLSHVGE